MTGKGYSDGCPVRDMVYRTYDCTPHHFVSNDFKTATLKISEPADFNFNPNTITTAKDPCAGCPWNQNALFGTTKPYIGDTPCQWCEHGTKLTCNDLNYCTSTTVDNTSNIKIRATSSIGLDEAFVKVDPSITASTMIDEYYDIDDLTIEEMAEAEREESKVWGNIYAQYLTKRGDK